jgi:tripartite-type tricarboxylate transporter receptor subunit TctC
MRYRSAGRLARCKSTDLPTRPITIVVPYAAGGPSDAIARATLPGIRRTVGAAN